MKQQKKRTIKARKRPAVLAFYYIFWAAILILLGALFVSQMESYNELSAELTRVTAAVEREQDQNERLTYQMNRLERDDYIERLARDLLGMVRPNEIVFRNIAD